MILAGYGARLATYRFEPDPAALACVGPAPAGKEGARDLATSRTNAGCTFFDGKHCTLHNLGLKPLEGRLAHHTRAWVGVRLEVLKHWRGRRFESVVTMLDKDAKHG